MTQIIFSTMDTYLESRGIGPIVAAAYKDMINKLLSIYAPSDAVAEGIDGPPYKDATMIRFFDSLIKNIIDVAVGSYIAYNGLGFPTYPTKAQIAAWMVTNRPDIPTALQSQTAGIPYIVFTNLNAATTGLLNGTVPTGDPQVPDNPVNLYAGLVERSLEQFSRFLRTAPGMTLTPDVSPNSSSYGETSVPVLPDVII